MQECLSYQNLREGESQLEGKCAIFGFKFNERYHVDRVPGAAFEERAVQSFTGAEFASDAQQRIDDDASKWRMVFVGSPETCSPQSGQYSTQAGDPEQPVQGFVYDGKNMRLTFALVSSCPRKSATS